MPGERPVDTSFSFNIKRIKDAGFVANKVTIIYGASEADVFTNEMTSYCAFAHYKPGQ